METELEKKSEKCMFDMILAVDKCFGIGNYDKETNTYNTPWDISPDMKFFSDKTSFIQNNNLKNVVIMGRNTWLSINPKFRPLRNRINIVLSSNEKLCESTEATVCPSLNRALDLCVFMKDKIENIFVIGGAVLYNEAVLHDDLRYVYMTRINHDYNCNIKVNFDMNKLLELTDKRFNIQDTKNNIKVDVSFNIFSSLSRNYKVDIFSIKMSHNDDEQGYLNLLEDVLRKGHYRKTRNANTYSMFGHHLEFDLDGKFPILTTKKVSLLNIFEELMFFLRGDTNTNHLSEKGVKIWESNTIREFLDSHDLSHYQTGDMGPLYSFQLRHFGSEYKGFNHNYSNSGFDQINYCLNLLKQDPYSRRIIMSTFNPSQAKECVLYPCHGIAIQFYVEADNKLSLMMYQRSADALLGLPYNITSYSLLTYLFCEVINNTNKETSGDKLTPGRLIISLGDVHIYENHVNQVIQQVLRKPLPFPQLKFKRPVGELTDFKFEDLDLINYHPYPNILAKMVA